MRGFCRDRCFVSTPNQGRVQMILGRQKGALTPTNRNAPPQGAANSRSLPEVWAKDASWTEALPQVQRRTQKEALQPRNPKLSGLRVTRALITVCGAPI